MKPAIFIDRDGTVNRDCPYCRNAEEIEIYQDIFHPLEELSREYYIIMVTNQSGVSRGYFTEQDLEGMHRKIRNEVEGHGGRIDAVYHCPHLPGAGCRCRKPGIGMIRDAMRDFDIDMSRSFFVGNSKADMEAGRRAGIPTICVRGDADAVGDFAAVDFNGMLEIIKKNAVRQNPEGLAVPKLGLILAGGKGTRMQPLTYEIPKPMAEVAGVPLIGHLVKEFRRNGILKIYVSIGYKGEMIEKYLGDGSAFGVDIEYVKEEEALGTGGGIRLGLEAAEKSYGGSDIFIANGDDILEMDLKPMYELYKRSGSEITLSLKKVENVSGSGVVVLEGERVKKFIEKPEGMEGSVGLVNLGRYITSPRIMDKFPKSKAFSFEKEFLQGGAERLKMQGYVVHSEWHQINTVKALEDADREYSARAEETRQQK